jgi:hypothetical protein
MEGQRMGAVAAVNDQTISDAQQRDLEARRRQGGAVALLKRDNSKVVEPDQPVHPSTRETAAPVLLPNETPAAATKPANGAQPSNGQPIFETTPNIIEPLPDNQQPPAAGGQPQAQPEQNVIPPLPDNQQPPASNQPQAQPEQNVIPPLPDNQQPPSAQPNGQQSAPPSNPPASNPQSQPQSGVIPPLPDNQQPPNAGTQKTPPKR